jgi:FMN phosphatase YigB (HAD superfamily)
MKQDMLKRQAASIVHPSYKPIVRRSMPIAYNAYKIIMKRKTNHVNLFLQSTKNVGKRSMPLYLKKINRDRFGNEYVVVQPTTRIPQVQRILPRLLLLFWMTTIACILSNKQQRFQCHAFFVPINSLLRMSFPRRHFTPRFAAASTFTTMDDYWSARVAGESMDGRPTLGLLTFDLDDTLFPINETVMNANVCQMEYLNQILLSMNVRLSPHLTVQDFQRTMTTMQTTLSKPCTYTELRKWTIRNLLLETGYFNTTSRLIDVDKVVDDAFSVWLQERHLAAERYIFVDAVTTLRTLQEQYPDICIAAITNGRGNPLYMTNTLAPYFDFCLSGEDDDVFPHRKPSSKIYEIAIQRYKHLYPHHNVVSQKLWCHVGDCLVNDVGGSAACGALAVWYCPDESYHVNKLNWTISDAESQERPRLNTSDTLRTPKIATRISNLTQLPLAIRELIQTQQLQFQTNRSDNITGSDAHTQSNSPKNITTSI